MRQSKGNYRRISTAQRPRASGQLLLLALLAAAVLAGSISLFTLHNSSRARQHTLHSDEGSLLAPSLEELYGSLNSSSSSSSSGPHQLLLLSYFNSRASLLARLLMLMGVFAGDGEQLKIDATNRLRWWELKQVTTLNELMLSQHAAPGLPPRLGRGFATSALTPDELHYYRDRAAGVTRYLGRHKPWLLKDPRLVWLAPLWMERLEAPLCIIMSHLQPALLAQQLAGRPVAEGELEVSPATHLERWTNATLSALQACIAVPTVLLPSSVLEPPLLQPFLAVLQQHLSAAGVQGTHLPSQQLLQSQYIDHLSSAGHHTAALPASNCKGSATAAAAAAAGGGGPATPQDAAELLQDSCNWLPVQQQQQDTPGALELPLPTQALLEALQQHLQETLAYPGKPGHDYRKTAGQLVTAYSRRVKQLLQQQPGQHGSSGLEHSYIASLISSALHHVAGERSLHGLRLRQ
uniref:Sulfotransferase n=1 Tax=Tetradesmus obliquus TaxID=3088 RepID=A0A383W8C6_TETOB|eukprot:jgi/Sobl393_1/2795/SZX73878.1